MKPECFGSQDAYNFNPSYLKDRICQKCRDRDSCLDATLKKAASGNPELEEQNSGFLQSRGL